eukprot:SAG31_NODE_5526_length_2478_cov_1.484237_3_plen_227_part_01
MLASPQDFWQGVAQRVPRRNADDCEKRWDALLQHKKSKQITKPAIGQNTRKTVKPASTPNKTSKQIIKPASAHATRKTTKSASVPKVDSTERLCVPRTDQTSKETSGSQRSRASNEATKHTDGGNKTQPAYQPNNRTKQECSVPATSVNTARQLQATAPDAVSVASTMPSPSKDCVPNAVAPSHSGDANRADRHSAAQFLCVHGFEAHVATFMEQGFNTVTDLIHSR